MWISRKTSEIDAGNNYGGRIGVVSVGGKNPAVITDGEARNAELVTSGGSVYLAKAGDEVFLERTPDGDTVVVGHILKTIPEGVSEGEVYIEASGGSIHIKNSGEIVISGNIVLNGRTDIDGVLMINGTPYVPAKNGG